jgi:ribosomal protein L11 methyltransferase
VRAVAIRVRAEHDEDTLDRLLPVAPNGIYDRALGPFVEFVLLPGATGAPVAAEVAAAVGSALVAVDERELPDDPADRLAQLVDAPVIANRFVVRPPAAPPPADPSLEDIVIDRGSAFGTGLHPTTRRCLELLLALEPTGSFADLGCGTGVLAIAAARLGWSPVTAVDYDEASVASAAHNAEVNNVIVAARRVDLLAEAPPAAATLVANVPPYVQESVRAKLIEAPARLIISGVSPADAAPIVESYAELGLVERRRLVEADWAAILLTAPDAPLREAHVDRGLHVRLPAAGAAAPPPAAPAASLPDVLIGQLATKLPNGAGLALSSGRELPTGARVAVLLAPGLFRLDLRHLEDTLKISVRNLSGSPIYSIPTDGPPRTILTTEDVTVQRPLATNARMRLRLGSGASAQEAEILLSALSGIETGLSRVSAQAVIRPVEGTSGAPPNVST